MKLFGKAHPLLSRTLHPWTHILMVSTLQQKTVNIQSMPFSCSLLSLQLRLSLIPNPLCSLIGYPIKKGTMIMLNNFDLNTSPKLWNNPEKFHPERFLTDSGTFRKPAHFLPFSTGKRACMGYKMVERITEGMLIAIIKDFDIVSLENPNVLPRSCVAVHPDTDIRIHFIRRVAD